MASRIVFTHAGWDDYRSWKASDPTVFEKITELIHSLACGEEIAGSIATHLGSGGQVVWSRRVHGKNRLVYAFDDGDLLVLQALYHEG